MKPVIMSVLISCSISNASVPCPLAICGVPRPEWNRTTPQLRITHVPLRLSRIFFVFLLLGVFFIGTNSTAWAAESWIVDPKMGCEIGWVSETSTVVKASWSGKNVQGKAEGKGVLSITLRGKDGKETQGRGDVEMKSGLLSGTANIQWSGGGSFSGDYKMGVREGRGVYKSAKGMVYDGEWKDDWWDGKGMLKQSDGTVFQGDFKHGKAEGNVVVKWTDGSEYAGLILNDMREGKGKQKFINGATYEGEFVHDRRSGSGALKDPGGKVIFSGLWKTSPDDSAQQF